MKAAVASGGPWDGEPAGEDPVNASGSGTPPVYRVMLPGDGFPRLVQACGNHPGYAFETAAGRYQLHCFFLSIDHGGARDAIEAVLARPDLFDAEHCAFYGVTVMPQDRGRLTGRLPGVRFAWDFDYSMSHACGAVPLSATPGQPTEVRRRWVLVDPSLHVLRIFGFDTPVEEVLQAVADLPPPERFGGVVRPAPILLLPNVFEPELCRTMIAHYEQAGGRESGVHRAGRPVLDASFKRRKDYTIEDAELVQRARRRVARRVLPEVERLFFMRADYIERDIIGCYSADDGGHFSPHTDNGPGLSAHRRYAVSINLNDDFDGGEVVFPEYNLHGYKAPAGWAVVFPCAALHAVRRVTRGARYAYLPFIYDEGGKAIRDAERAASAPASTSLPVFDGGAGTPQRDAESSR